MNKKKGLGVSYQAISTGSQWFHVKKTWHINVQDLEAMKLAILLFTKLEKLNSIHLWIDNMTALSYLLNMGRTQNKHLIQISKQIWGYLLQRKISLTAEYIPSASYQTSV